MRTWRFARREWRAGPRIANACASRDMASTGRVRFLGEMSGTKWFVSTAYVKRAVGSWQVAEPRCSLDSVTGLVVWQGTAGRSSLEGSAT